MARGRQIAPLSEKSISNLKPEPEALRPKLHAVGGVAGLHLQVTPTGAKSWVLRIYPDGRRREMGLGSYPEVSLARARQRAAEAREEIWQGTDPIETRKSRRHAKSAERARTITFAEATEQFLKIKLPGLKSEKERNGGYRSSLDQYAMPVLGKLSVADILTPDVLKVLTPIWSEKPEVARKLRIKIDGVLAWATTHGFREGENPARLKGNLEHALPKVKRKQTHQPALSLKDASSWMTDLRDREGMASRALEFLALTTTRSGEVRGMVWPEVDLDAGIWIIPAGRMKAGKEHRVPLPEDAIELLRHLPRMNASDFVFPASRGGMLSDMALSACMKRISKAKGNGYLDAQSGRPAVPHGLRSTFRTWAAERGADRDMAEMQLAHDVASDVERSYQRSDMLDRRRSLLEAWSRFLSGVDAQVIEFKAAGTDHKI